MRYLKNYVYAQICYVTRYQTFVMIKLKDTPLKDTSGFAPSQMRLTPLSGGWKGLRPLQTSMYTIF